MIYFNNKPVQITSKKPTINNDRSMTYTFTFLDFSEYTKEEPITEQFKTFITNYEKEIQDII